MSDAIRAGWLMAELRGRLRPGGPSPTGPVLGRGGHALPLPSERSPTEQIIEARRVLGSVAATLGVGSPQSQPSARPFEEQLEERSKALDSARQASDAAAAETAWNAVAELIYSWDAVFQDAMPGKSIEHGRAYEIGRALAEMYWALDPDAPATDDSTGKPTPTSWEFLFGAERVGVIDERLRSLAPHYHPATCPAVSATVHAWAALGTGGQLRALNSDQTCDSLRQQLESWHELLVVGVDPETLLKPYAGLRFTKITPKVVRSFAAEAAIVTVGLAGLVSLAFLAVEVQGAGGWKTLAAVAGVLGVTIGGVQAALKNATQSLLGRLRADLYTDLVTNAVTSLPPVARKTKRAALKAGTDRPVTAPLSSRVKN